MSASTGWVADGLLVQDPGRVRRVATGYVSRRLRSLWLLYDEVTFAYTRRIEQEKCDVVSNHPKPKAMIAEQVMSG
jgi:hypothetical protein